jgi:phage baseplate assembly protein W
MTESGAEDIEQSLRLLFRTRPGDRVTLLDYGCGLEDMLFHPTTSRMTGMIKEQIRRAIIYYEPRILIEEIHIDTNQAYEGIIRIRLDYIIRENNSRHNIVFPFYELEGTNVNL